MYTILVTDDNELVTSVKERIMQRSKLVDNLHFLVPQMYKNNEMSMFTCTMEYILPVSREYETEILVKSDELYKDMIEFKLPLDTNLTKEAGKIEIQLTFTKVSMDADGNLKQQVRKTSPTTISIIAISEWSNIIPDNALSALDQRIVMLDAYANQLMDVQQNINDTKADNIVYNEEDNTIQLSANGSLIGDKIVIGSANINAIKKLEVDEEENLIVTYMDDTIENIGNIGNKCKGIYVPTFVDPDKLIFTLQDEPGDNEIIIDIDKTNEWSGVDENLELSNYIWEQL